MCHMFLKKVFFSHNYEKIKIYSDDDLLPEKTLILHVVVLSQFLVKSKSHLPQCILRKMFWSISWKMMTPKCFNCIMLRFGKIKVAKGWFDGEKN